MLNCLISATVAPVDHANNVVDGVFAQAFFEKACGQAVSSKGYIM